MAENEDYLSFTQLVPVSFGGRMLPGDLVALESLRDQFWLLTCTDSKLEDFVSILEKIRDAKSNFLDNVGTESRLAFYDKIRIQSIRDVLLFGQLLKLQLPQRKRDQEWFYKLVDDASKIQCETQDEQREKLKVLITLAWSRNSNKQKVVEGLFEECVKLTTRDESLERSLRNMCSPDDDSDKGINCRILKTLILRYYYAAEESNSLRYTDYVSAKQLRGLCTDSEILAVAEEIFRIKQKVKDYYPTSNLSAPPTTDRFKYLAWDALELATLYFDAGRFADAEKSCLMAIDWYGTRKTVSEMIGQFGLRIHLSKFRIAQGKYDAARADLISALEFADPLTEDDYADDDVFRPWAPARILLAKVLIYDGAFDKAEDLLFKAIDQPGYEELDLPGTKDAISELKQLAHKSKRGAEIERRLVEIETEAAGQRVVNERIMQRNSIPGYFMNNYPYLDEMKEGRKYIRLLSTFACTLPERIHYLCEFASECLDFDRYELCDESIDEAFRQLSFKDKEHNLLAEILDVRARMFICTGKFVEAEDDLNKLLKIWKPGEVGNQFAAADLGSLKFAQQNFEQAESQLSAACEKLQESSNSICRFANLLFDLAYTKYQHGDTIGAKQNLERSAKLLDSNSEAWRDESFRCKVISLLALVFDSSGKTQEAEFLMSEALARGGIAPRRNLAWILMNAGTLAEKKGNNLRARRLFAEAQSVIDELGVKRGMLSELVRTSSNRVNK